jgi:hypothetical protein
MRIAHRAAALIAALGMAAAASAADAIKFGEDFDAAVASAKKDGKLVLVDFSLKN